MIPHNVALALIIVSGVGLAFIIAPAAVCHVTTRHKYGEWDDSTSMFHYVRNCRRCGKAQVKETAWWSAIINQPRSMSPIAEPATDPISVWSKTGTSEIPRLSNGALSSTPAPPQVAGPGRVVLDHEL